MHRTHTVVLIALLLAATPASADVPKRAVNNGNLILEGIPEIPQSVVDDLNRYQNVRYASFLDWSNDGESVYVATRFADVQQIHRVDGPGGARHQLTFFSEPVGQVVRQPGTERLGFAMDAGGSEFSQLFLLDTASGEHTMLTDGESRNTAMVFSRDGERLAWQSTRRNGSSNDIWVMDPDDPESARIALEAPDGSWWGAADFDRAGAELLVQQYISITDSRIHRLDLDSGEYQRVDGGGDSASTNYAVAFDAAGDGFYFITNQGGEFNQLAYAGFDAARGSQIVTADIPWDVTAVVFNEERSRGAFVTNEDGISRLYLFDPRRNRYRLVESLPTGVIGQVAFSPDGSALGMTLNTPQTPSDTFTLELGRGALDYRGLERWTYSEVGGLDTSTFATPELVHFPTFDEVGGEPRRIPAFVYKPQGDGPFPVVVSIHGGPEAQARPVFSSTYQLWLQKLGVAVVVPNVRGSAGYGKSYLELDNGFKREDSVRDIGALLDWIAAEPTLDADRVAVFGGSYGGYMVLASSVHYSDRLRGAVNIVGISNFVTFLENTQDYRRDLRRVEYGDERDPEMRAHLERISPLNNVDRIDVPMFVVQGQNDPRVPVTEAEQIVRALRDGGQPVWYMNALNEGHGYRKKENRDVYEQAVVLFFRDNLLN